MGCIHREFVPSVRRTHGLVLYFKDKECVQASQDGATVIFHRWLVKRPNFYRKNWRPFCDRLKRSDELFTIWDVMDIASRFGISMQSPIHPYEVPKGIYRHPSRYNKHSHPRRPIIRRRKSKSGGKTLYEIIKEEKG